jgi:hypothetical protein
LLTSDRYKSDSIAIEVISRPTFHKKILPIGAAAATTTISTTTSLLLMMTMMMIIIGLTIIQSHNMGINENI